LEQQYLDARENAVSRVRINLTLAIRNAFDRLQDDRANKAAHDRVLSLLSSRG